MKLFLVQTFWFIVIFAVLGLLLGVTFSILFPHANHEELGRLSALPILIVSLIVTSIGSRTGKLPGTRREE